MIRSVTPQSAFTEPYPKVPSQSSHTSELQVDIDAKGFGPIKQTSYSPVCRSRTLIPTSANPRQVNAYRGNQALI